MKDWILVVAAFLGVLVVLSFPTFAIIGNYQICKRYYPDINRLACMASTKSGVPARSGQ